MKTVPHIVEEKHLRLFHPVSQSATVPAKTFRKASTRKASVRKAPARKAPNKKTSPRSSRKALGRKAVKKTIKGRVTKRSRQSKVRRQRGNFKDIFSR